MNEENKFQIKSLNVFYNNAQALKDINLNIKRNEILGIIGPANSGKTTFLRTLNRLNDLVMSFKSTGEILLDDKNIFKEVDVSILRKRVGMVFALPVVLPMSIYNNIIYGPKMHDRFSKKKLDSLVEKTLRAAYLWDEVKDRLNTSATKLSGGQQQRLCIARTLAVQPEVLLFDEPCSGLDPISTARIEEAMVELKKNYTIVLVTNNTKQAARVGDRVAFFLSGELIEIDTTGKIFTSPSNKKTEDYISGKFG